jgi:DNA-binding Lrp family transcriptional regulator
MFPRRTGTKERTMQEILDLLQNDARLSPEDIAAMTKKSVEEVAAVIAQLEKDGVILKYTAIVNQEKIPSENDTVRAVIEIQVTPEREHGFDSLAERIYRFPQVKALYLMSGGYDLQVIIEGKTLKEVAFFVSQKLATLNGVKSTKTHFVLKTYKENDIVYVDSKKDNRESVTA